MTLKRDEILTIKLLTLQGVSEAEIVRRTGKSRNSVRRWMQKARQTANKTPKDKLASLIRYKITPSTPSGRCPLCQRVVYLPCKACLTRIYDALCDKPAAPVNPLEITSIDTLFSNIDATREQFQNTLELRPAERKRYEKIKRRKDQENQKL